VIAVDRSQFTVNVRKIDRGRALVQLGRLGSGSPGRSTAINFRTDHCSRSANCNICNFILPNMWLCIFLV